MKETKIKILSADFITHNVLQLRVEKPAGFEYLPGQATELGFTDAEGDKDFRPFTITSRPDQVLLEFMIKIYPDHCGVTKRLANVTCGEQLLIREPFGAISFKGPGLFIAAGTGITPFIAIFRSYFETIRSTPNILLFANRTKSDTFLTGELKALFGQNYSDVLSEEENGTGKKYIDKEMLQPYTHDKHTYYYVCGPDGFVAAMITALNEHGISSSRIITEE